jgi:imidazolonepropionase-like amidohydrolase
VAIAAGSDAGTPLNAHGAYATELELMVKYEMSPLEAIRAATSVAAEALGLGGETGRIAPGLAADLLVVAGNPAERIQALGAVRMVLARGRVARPFAVGG